MIAAGASAMTGTRLRGGFTLIELLVAMAVLGIVLAVAIPNYRQWVLASGRAEAKAVLMDGAQTLERCFTRFSRYNDGSCALTGGSTLDSESGKYQMTVTAVSPTAFTLTAVPKGGQTEDTDCANFTLTSAGVRDVTGPAGKDKCW